MVTYCTIDVKRTTWTQGCSVGRGVTEARVFHRWTPPAQPFHAAL